MPFLLSEISSVWPAPSQPSGLTLDVAFKKVLFLLPFPNNLPLSYFYFPQSSALYPS